MDRLMDEELGVLDSETRQWYHSAWYDAQNGLVSTMGSITIRQLIGKLARALTPQSCGHPRGCVVASPYMAEVGESNHCGWCAEEMSHGHALVDLEECRKERDDLRERLAMAKAEKDVIDALLNAAVEGLKVAADDEEDYDRT